ncbi:hypothetical protein B0H12DRAFT_1271817 [Mycena haematopus]|nr:hypothetical protein B0H12DRAFT_1271817 [Mycena haematopus]
MMPCRVCALNTLLEAWSRVVDGCLTQIQFQNGLYVDLLNLCHECGVYSCIPTIGFECLSSWNLERTSFHRPRTRRWIRAILSSATKLTLALALERIIFFQRSATAWLNDDALIPHQSCRMAKSCIRQKRAMSRSVTTQLIMKKETHDIHYAIGQWRSVWSGKLCDECEHAAKVYHEAGRQKCWELLPTFFGYPEWKDLEDLV